jgi:hypothetical protein
MDRPDARRFARGFEWQMHLTMMRSELAIVLKEGATIENGLGDIRWFSGCRMKREQRLSLQARSEGATAPNLSNSKR